MESKRKKKSGHEEPRGKMGIKMKTYKRMDLRIWGGGRVTWDKVREWHGHIYTTKRKIGSGKQPHSTGRSARFCVQLEGWDREGGRETQEGGDMGIYVYV